MTSLATITQVLDQICDEIDAVSGEFPQDLLERFTTAQMAHAEKVGAYVAVIETLKKNASYYEERAKLLARRARTAVKLEAAIKERLMFQIEHFPDLPWRSSEGDKIGVRNNPEGLKVDVPMDHRHINNIIPMETMIPVEFVTVATLYTLNTEAVRQFLKMGGTLSWARLERGKHVRIY